MAIAIALSSSPSLRLSSPPCANQELRPERAGSPARPAAPRMVFNGAPARSARVAGNLYRRLDFCLVIPPPLGRKPRAIIKFLGGAFVGTIPEATDGHLMELLAKEGFLIVSVPYNVTFDHTGASREVYEKFHNCMDVLLNNGLPDANLLVADLISFPLYSVGHSNGALLQLLVGSYYSEKIPEANAGVSFNNRPASEAIPCFEQVTQGTLEFKPAPSENLEYFKKSYSVPHTLLVKFSTDDIDETDVLEDILRPHVESIDGTLQKVTLPGNHLTPCIQDLHYTPADALAQGLKSPSLNDTRVLARTIADWFKGLNRR